MKKWMALLLACLLCLCVAGAMAEEPVTLELVNEGNNYYYVYKIYPDGYDMWGRQRDNNVYQYGGFRKYTGPYIITGNSIMQDVCLDFYSIPHGQTETTNPVTYTVIFQNVDIHTLSGDTALRFGFNEGSGGKDITLNLINFGSSITMHHDKPSIDTNPVFSNAGDNNVYVNLHNADDRLLLYKHVQKNRNRGLVQ